MSSPEFETFAQRLAEAQRLSKKGDKGRAPPNTRLAEVTGKADSSVGKWLAGKSEPSLADVAKLGDYLEVSLLWLAFNRGPMYVTQDAPAVREGVPLDPASRAVAASAGDAEDLWRIDAARSVPMPRVRPSTQPKQG